MRFFNTLTRNVEDFVPLDPKRIGLYNCGPTVYDWAHIGNARPAVAFDVLYRLLRREYGANAVRYARNITDIDDKIIAAAQADKVTIGSITDRTTKQYQDDMLALHCLAPDVEPRCTGHIPQMVAMIETLIAKGNAYAAEGHVLFAVSTMPEYGALSRRSQDEMIAGARVEVAPYKREPADFVLWKPSEADQPGWDSPWGRGRPGWHIECSAMAAEHLGEVFDIHAGGLDLIFPHHENEIAQSRCAHGTQVMAKMWLHNGFVTVDGEKMSKSLGNFVTVHELLAEFPGEAIRLALLTAHYRQPLDLTRDGIAIAKGHLDRWYTVIRKNQTQQFDPPEEFLDALADDLNTPEAIAILHGYTHIANTAKSLGERTEAASRLKAAARLLGLLEADPLAWDRWTPHGYAGPSDAEIEDLIAQRLAARAAKDFAKADALRDTLAGHGVQLEDAPGSTYWRRC